MVVLGLGGLGGMVSRSWGGHTAVLSLAVLPPLAPRVLTEGLGTQLRGILEMLVELGAFGAGVTTDAMCPISYAHVHTHTQTHTG